MLSTQSSIPQSLPFTAQRLNIARIDRWTVTHRLQELQINSWCFEDGSCWVDIPDSTTALLLRSVMHHCLAPRQELTQWLERCWQVWTWNTGPQD